MILYLDASALVKRYVAETGSETVARAIADAEMVGTSILSRAETVAALTRIERGNGRSDFSSHQGTDVVPRTELLENDYLQPTGPH